MSYVPQYINKTFNFEAGHTVTDTEYNETFNLLIAQGDYNSAAMLGLGEAMTNLSNAQTALTEELNNRIADISAGAVVDGCVTYEKLDNNLQAKIDTLDDNDVELEAVRDAGYSAASGYTELLVEQGLDVADCKLQMELKGSTTSKTNKFFVAPMTKTFKPTGTTGRIEPAVFTVLQQSIANGATSISANGYGLTKVKIGTPLTIIGCDQNKKPTKVEVTFSEYSHVKETLYFEQPFTYPDGVTAFTTGIGYYTVGSCPTSTGVGGIGFSSTSITVNGHTITFTNGNILSVRTDNYGRAIIFAYNSSDKTKLYVGILSNTYLADPLVTSLNMLDTTIFKPYALSGLPTDVSPSSLSVTLYNNALLFSYVMRSGYGVKFYLSYITLATLKNVSAIPAFMTVSLGDYYTEVYGGVATLLKNHIFLVTTRDEADGGGWYGNLTATLVSLTGTVLTDGIALACGGWGNESGNVAAIMELETATGSSVFVFANSPGTTTNNGYDCGMSTIVNDTLVYGGRVSINGMHADRASFRACYKLKTSLSGSTECILFSSSYRNEDDENSTISYQIINSDGTEHTIPSTCPYPNGSYYLGLYQNYEMKDMCMIGYASAPPFTQPNYYGVTLPLDYRLPLEREGYVCRMNVSGNFYVCDGAGEDVIGDDFYDAYLGESDLIQIRMQQKTGLGASGTNNCHVGTVGQFLEHPYYSTYDKYVFSNDITLPTYLDNNKDASSNYFAKNTIRFYGIPGHKYAVGLTFTAKDSLNFKLTSGTETYTTPSSPYLELTTQRINFVITCANTGLMTLEITASANGITVGKGYNFAVLNMTQAYGVGKELTLASLNNKWTTSTVVGTSAYLNNEGPTKIIGVHMDTENPFGNNYEEPR